jgi:hypothetical protein
MHQPEGYHEGTDNLVCKLNKSLYGLKQGANEWNRKLHDTLSQHNFRQSPNDPCLYTKKVNSDWMFLSIHVDDLIVASTSDEMLKGFEQDMKGHFIMKELGKLNNYIGMQIEQDTDGLFLMHQRSYIEKKLNEFNLSDGKPSKIPLDTGYQKQQNSSSSEDMENKEVYRRAIGSLLYLATNTRPDIAVSTSILARKVENPTQTDWGEVKRVFKYLISTKDKKLKLGSRSEYSNRTLIGFADADWAGDTIDRKSNTGYVFKYLGSPICWSSKRQSLVTLSSTEAEHIALSEATKEGLWIKRLLNDFEQDITGPIVMFEDNQSCIKLIQDERACLRTKHIDTKYHFLRELHKSKNIDIRYCPTDEMQADILTKPVGANKLKQLCSAIGLI